MVYYVTYHIPIIPKHIPIEVLNEVLKEYFTRCLGMPTSINSVERIVFQNIKGKPRFKSAFVYHKAFVPASGIWTFHFNALATRGAGIWSNSCDYPYNMPLVDRINKSIYIAELNKQPLKVDFNYEDKAYYLLLLPNHKPLYRQA